MDPTTKYYREPLEAFVRGRLGAQFLPCKNIVDQAHDAGLAIHKFKRKQPLARVTRALGVLKGLAPESLLDVGSGRGAFLWPLLEEFPSLSVIALENDPIRVRDLSAINEGGLSRLTAVLADIEHFEHPSKSVDGVTMLEVLEHLDAPDHAAGHAIRIAKRFVVVSVPSTPDDNPQHVRLFDEPSLVDLLTVAGARRVTTTRVLNHIIGCAIVSP